MKLLKPFFTVFCLMCSLQIAGMENVVLRVTDDLMGLLQDEIDIQQRMQNVKRYLEKHKGEKHRFDLVFVVNIIANTCFNDLYENDLLRKSLAGTCAQWLKAGLVSLPEETELGLLLQRMLPKIKQESLSAICYSFFFTGLPEEKIDRFPRIFENINNLQVQCALFNDTVAECLPEAARLSHWREDYAEGLKKLLDPRADKNNAFSPYRSELLKKYDREGNKKLIALLNAVRKRKAVKPETIEHIRNLAASGFVFGSSQQCSKLNKWLTKVQTLQDVTYLLDSVEKRKQDAHEIHKRYPAIDRIPTAYADIQFKFD